MLATHLGIHLFVTNTNLINGYEFSLLNYPIRILEKKNSYLKYGKVAKKNPEKPWSLTKPGGVSEATSKTKPQV